LPLSALQIYDVVSSQFPLSVRAGFSCPIPTKDEWRRSAERHYYLACPYLKMSVKNTRAGQDA